MSIQGNPCILRKRNEIHHEIYTTEELWLCLEGGNIVKYWSETGALWKLSLPKFCTLSELLLPTLTTPNTALRSTSVIL